MIISGDTNRRMLTSQDYSYLLDFSINNTTGSAFFGFSGQGQRLGFTFDRGRILDPANKYIQSYNPNQTVSLSGNMNSGSYDYQINQDLICQSSTGAFFADNFIFNVTGCAVDFDLYINTYSVPTLAFTFPTGFTANENLSVTVSGSGNDRPFTVFSGALLLGDAASQNFYFQNQFPFALQAETGLSLSSSGTTQGSTYPINLVLYTSFGTIKTGFSTTSQLDEYITNWSVFNYNNSGSGNFSSLDQNANDLVSSGTAFDSFGNWRVFYDISPSGVSKTLRLKLTYSGGGTGAYTGNYVTGVSMTYGGSGYSSAPSVGFAGGGGNGAAGLAFTGAASTVTGVLITNPGSGYTSDPTVSFAGGSPASGASGLALLSGYNKNFTGTWNLFTGGSSTGLMTNFAQNNYVDPAITGFTRTITLPYTTTNFFIVVKNHAYYDTDLQYAKLEISGLSPTANYYSTIITGGYQ